MNKRNSVLATMLWKDAATIRPLLIAVLIGILGLNFLVLISAWLYGGRAVTPHVMLWTLMPNLVALGAPAMLVGSEEENGTLAWLRTLPVSWQRIVDSKFIVAFVSLLLSWAASSALLFLIVANWSGSIDPVSRDLFSAWGVAKLGFFSCLLLTMSFMTAYLFRSPIAGLIALVPTITIVYTLLGYAVAAFIAKELAFLSHYRSGTTRQWATVVVAAIAFLCLVWLIQRWLGGRRLTFVPKANSIANKIGTAKSAYRPPAVVGLQRPSMSYAMHWQQIRQIGIPAMALTVIGAAFLAILASYRIVPGNEAQFFIAIAPAVASGCALWLGALVFYGDSIRGRNAFFADRGISPTRVWWTRMAFPSACCVVLCVVALLTPDNLPYGTPTMPVWVLLVCFASGQLVSQWVTRPMLSFFAAPVYVLACAALASWFLWQYQNYNWMAIVLALILVFASWKLVTRWINGQVDVGYHWRAVAFSCLGLFLPIAGILAHRVATMPSRDSVWVSKMMSQSNDTVLRVENLSQSELTELYANQGSSIGGYNRIARTWGGGTPLQYAERFEEKFKSAAGFREALNLELSGDEAISLHVDAYDIAFILNNETVFPMSYQHRQELRRKSLQVALSWSNRIRKAALKNYIDFYWFEQSAEAIDPTVARLLLQDPRRYGSDEEISEVVAMFPSKELRRDSRKQVLLREWREYQDAIREKEKDLIDRETVPTFGATILVESPLEFEHERSRRFLDQLVRLTLEQLDNGLPAEDSSGRSQRAELWIQAHGPSQYSRWNPHSESFCQSWTSNHEDAVRKLQNRYPIRSTEE